MDRSTATTQLPPERRGSDTTWRCPVCMIAVPHPHRPGRARVYCTDACKQRAYRWRQRHRAEIISPMPPERAHTYDRAHAVRSDADFTSQQRHRRPRGHWRRLTVCGAFATAANEAHQRVAHTKFYAPATRYDPHRPSDNVCHSCVTLLGVPVEPLETILDRLVPHRTTRRTPPRNRLS